jgi:hypothetical protein
VKRAHPKEGISLTGIQFITDEKGRKTAAIIDLINTRRCGKESRTREFYGPGGMKSASRSIR